MDFLFLNLPFYRDCIAVKTGGMIFAGHEQIDFAGSRYQAESFLFQLAEKDLEKLHRLLTATPCGHNRNTRLSHTCLAGPAKEHVVQALQMGMLEIYTHQPAFSPIEENQQAPHLHGKKFGQFSRNQKPVLPERPKLPPIKLQDSQSKRE